MEIEPVRFIEGPFS